MTRFEEEHLAYNYIAKITGEKENLHCPLRGTSCTAGCVCFAKGNFSLSKTGRKTYYEITQEPGCTCFMFFGNKT